MKIDHRDWVILRHLQRNGRLSSAELAQRVGMAPSTLWRRVRALEDAGVISGYGARVDPQRAGLGFEAIVHVQLTRHDEDERQAFNRLIARRPEVVEAFATTGQADYHLRVVVPDLEAYNAFLESVLFRQPAVASAQTNVVLKRLKSWHGYAPPEDPGCL